jgi:hypothetical protein
LLIDFATPKLYNFCLKAIFIVVAPNYYKQGSFLFEMVASAGIPQLER